MSDTPNNERQRRWRLALGDDAAGSSADTLGERDRRMDQALTALYGTGEEKKGRGGLGGSSPRVARWLGDVREFFPSPVVQVIQRDAFERLGLKRMLLEPEFLASVEADIHLVADLMSLGKAMPEESKATARLLVRKVIDQLMERLAQRTASALRGALNRASAHAVRVSTISTGRVPSGPISAPISRSTKPSCRSGWSASNATLGRPTSTR